MAAQPTTTPRPVIFIEIINSGTFLVTSLEKQAINRANALQLLRLVQQNERQSGASITRIAQEDKAAVLSTLASEVEAATITDFPIIFIEFLSGDDFLLTVLDSPTIRVNALGLIQAIAELDTAGTKTVRLAADDATRLQIVVEAEIDRLTAG